MILILLPTLACSAYSLGRDSYPFPVNSQGPWEGSDSIWSVAKGPLILARENTFGKKGYLLAKAQSLGTKYRVPEAHPWDPRRQAPPPPAPIHLESTQVPHKADPPPFTLTQSAGDDGPKLSSYHQLPCTPYPFLSCNFLRAKTPREMTDLSFLA